MRPEQTFIILQNSASWRTVEINWITATVVDLFFEGKMISQRKVRLIQQHSDACRVDPIPECVQNDPDGHSSHLALPSIVLTVPSSHGFCAVIPNESQ